MRHLKKAGFYTTLAFLATVATGCNTTTQDTLKTSNDLEKKICSSSIHKTDSSVYTEKTSQIDDNFKYIPSNSDSKIAYGMPEEEIKKDSHGRLTYILHGHDIILNTQAETDPDAIAEAWGKDPEEIKKIGNQFIYENKDIIQKHTMLEKGYTFSITAKTKKAEEELKKLKR